MLVTLPTSLFSHINTPSYFVDDINIACMWFLFSLNVQLSTSEQTRKSMVRNF